MPEAIKGGKPETGIGIASPSFSTKKFDEICSKICKCFSHWELLMEGNLSQSKIELPLADLLSTGSPSITIHAPMSDVNIGSVNDTIRDHSVEIIKRTVEFVAELEIPLMTMHPAHLSPLGMLMTEEVSERNVRSLRAIMDYAAEYDVEIALENMPMVHWTLGNTPEEVALILNQVNEERINKLGFCLDIGHANVASDVALFIDRYFTDRLLNLHLHNNFGDKDSHLELDRGDIEVKEVLSEIIEVKGSLPPQLIIESNNLEEGISSKGKLEVILDDLGVSYR